MSIHLSMVVVVLFAVADETKKKDEDNLQGSWEAVEVIGEGEKQPAEQVKKMSIVFKDDSLVLLVAGKEEEKYTFKLDPSKKPKTIDFTEKGAKEPVPGIYELDGDAVKLCWNKAEKIKGRPDKFTSTPENKFSMMTLKRKGK